MKFFGLFAYNAKVVPKGSRKPRGEVLFGMTEYDIAEIAESDLVTDAVRATCRMDFRIRAADSHDRAFSLHGWDRRLWADPNPGQPWSAEDFVADCQKVYPLSFSESNPIAQAYDPSDGPRWINVDAGKLETNHEDRFSGSIVSSYRAEAEKAYQDAARHVVLAGGRILTERREPTWTVRDDDRPGVRLTPSASFPRTADIFRLDRLADAVEWSARFKNADMRAVGSIESLDASFLRRDDLAHAAGNSLGELVGSKFLQFLPYLPADILPVWQKLAHHADRMRGTADIGLPAGTTTQTAVRQLRTLQEHLTAARLPVEMHEDRRKMLTGPYERFFDRVKFETTRRPGNALDSADDHAIGSLKP